MTTNISFTVDRQSLTRALVSLQKMSNGQKNSTTHLLAHGDALSLFLQTDTRTLLVDTSITQLIGEGGFTTDIKKLTEFIQTVHGKDITVSLTDSSMKVVCGTTRGTFPLTREEAVIPLRATSGASVPFTVLGDALSLLLYSCSTETSRPTLSSLCILPLSEGGARLVATDGFRLSLVQITSPIGITDKILVPASFLRDALSIFNESKNLQIKTSEDSTTLIISQDGLQATTRLMVGEYPPYEKVLVHAHENRFVFKKSEILDAVKTISIFARDHSNIVVFSIDKSKVQLRPKKEAGAENSTDIVFTETAHKGEMNIAFNYRYLVDFLGSVDDELFTMRVNRADAPILFLPGDVEDDQKSEGFYYQHVIMPVRLQE
ncbi:MAG: DNA polymerase III subunit beta [Candidatus Roizmanbacteria bacterium]